MRFWKYHAAGNDYLVVDDSEPVRDWTDTQVQHICDRHRGIGGDGILLVEQPTDHGYGVRILNPDGSEAEKSGNGLRITARYLWDQHRVGDSPFAVQTQGGITSCQVLDAGQIVRVGLGQASFDSREIPVLGPAREVLQESLPIDGATVIFSAVTVGNPHCVVFRDEVSEAETRKWGPLIERAPCFPNRTNVQFVHIVNDRTLKIEIWERGAGYTLSSGTSSCAAAAVAHRLGRVGQHVSVQTAGGTLRVEIDDHYRLTLTGPVVRVGCFDADPAWIAPFLSP